jgi:hypothetical protein
MRAGRTLSFSVRHVKVFFMIHQEPIASGGPTVLQYSKEMIETQVEKFLYFVKKDTENNFSENLSLV